MARQRDYRAEERRRNEIAKAAGFSNRAQMRRARSARQIPTAKEIRRDPKIAAQFEKDSRARRAGFATYKEYLAARAEARRWSDTHSRQPVSTYRPSLSPEKFGRYHRALVKPWGRRRTLEDREALQDWLVDYYDDPDYESPYR